MSMMTSLMGPLYLAMAILPWKFGRLVPTRGAVPDSDDLAPEVEAETVDGGDQNDHQNDRGGRLLELVDADVPE